jgi:hypothetical protein
MTVQVAVTADTTQATVSLKKLADLAGTVTGLKAGWKTTEFWHVVGVLFAAGLTLVFHKNFDGVVQAVAIGGAALASAVYAASRANLKKPYTLAAVRYDYQALQKPVSDLAAQVLTPTVAPPVAPPVVPAP